MDDKVKIGPMIKERTVSICFLFIFIVLFLSFKEKYFPLQLTSKCIAPHCPLISYAVNGTVVHKIRRSPRCFWPYYMHGYHSADNADNNEQIDIFNREHFYFNSDANITASFELKRFHYSLSPDSFASLRSQSSLFDDCQSTIKYQQLLLISLRQHKYCQLQYFKYNISQLCALHNARLNSLSTYLPTHFNELITHELTGSTKLNFLLNTYPYPKSKYFNSSGAQNSLFITDPDTIIVVYTSYSMWPMTKVWLFNMIKYQPYLLARIVIGCYDYDVHEQVIEFNKKMSLLKATQIVAKNYSVTLIQSLWRNIYKNIPNLFIHPEIIEQFVSSLVWSDQILPSFVISQLSPLKLSAKIDTKNGHRYMSTHYLHMVWGKITNSHRALENGFSVIIHDTDELSFHDPTEWITPKSWSDDYIKFICDHSYNLYNTGLVLWSHYGKPILKWWHGMEINSLYSSRQLEDQRVLEFLLHQQTRSVKMNHSGSLIALAAIEKARFEFRLMQRLNIRIRAKQKLQTEFNNKSNIIDDSQILEFIRSDPHLLQEYESTFLDICSNQVSVECFYSVEGTTISKPTKRPQEVEHFLSNLTFLNKTASDYLQTFSHLFIQSNFSTYQFFNSVSEFIYYLSLYLSTNRSELAWCPPEIEGLRSCNATISKNWTNINQLIEVGTLLTYHYNCLPTYNDKVDEMKRHGNWIEN